MTGKEVSDLLYGIALFVNAALFIPQAIKIFSKKKTEIRITAKKLLDFLNLVNIRSLIEINDFMFWSPKAKLRDGQLCNERKFCSRFKML